MLQIKRIVFFLMVSLGSSFTLFAQNPDIWGETENENRPFVRWWWLGSAVNEEGLSWNLEQFAEAGLGGVEITPIYGVQGNDSNDIPYLSSRWMEVYNHTMLEASRLGLQIDMNNGTGWPFGGPHITTDHSAMKFIPSVFEVAAGQKVEQSLSLHDKRQKSTARIHCVVAVGMDFRSDITNCVYDDVNGLKGRGIKASDAVLRWTADDSCKIYVLYSGHTYQKVKRAAPGGEGLVMNHYSADVLEHYLTRFDEAFSVSGAPWPDTFFNDSFEVYGSDWTSDLSETFEQEHGYKLEMMLPEFLGDGNPDVCARIVTDYRETLAGLLERNFTVPWTEWAHSHGVRTRNQAHGSPANIIDLYAAVDIPECESFGRSEFNIPGLRQDTILKPNDGDPAVLKFASSAAHLTGRKYTSAEALTWLTEHFRTSLSQCKPEVDQMFAAGVNHLYFHGAPYSPKGVAFPAWKFYAAINMSPTNNLWNHAPAFFDYVTRCQTFLTSGRSDNDLLLYVPLYDIWHEQQEKQFLIFDIHKMDLTMPKVKEAMNNIVSSGYDADYISDRLILSLDVDKGELVSSGGTRYKGVIIPSCHKMPLETMKKLAELARKGADVMFLDHLPEDVPGWGRLEERRAQMDKVLGKLARYAKIGTNYEELASSCEAVKEVFKAEENGTMTRRRNEHGGYNYFLSMLHGEGFDGWLQLGTPAAEAFVMDPLTGNEGKAKVREGSNGNAEVYLQLAPGQSLLVATFPEKTKYDCIPEWNYVYERGTPIILDSGWSISFPKSDPAIEKIFYTDTLVQWCSLPDERAAVNCATARYSTSFDFARQDGYNDYILDLGDVRESARIWVNGHEIGTLFSVPFSINIGKYLKDGNNQLTIEVCNLPSNRIADLERRGVKWRIFKDANISSVTGAKQFDFGEWDTDPSGLNSYVSIIPVK